jgi:hypothetical protein
MLLTQGELVRAYHATFASPQGQLVLQHLLDTVYFSVYEGKDHHEAAVHNARRSVVHEILLNIDIGEHPEKYVSTVSTKAEEIEHAT